MASTSNRACVLLKEKTVEIRDIAMPSVGAGDVLIKVESTGICGSDLHNYNHGGAGNVRISGPLVLGHESAGVIVQAGNAVTEVKVGDRVAIEPTMFCRRCANCKIGKTNICRSVRQASMTPTQGTLSQYYACEADYTVKVPESISWEEAGCIQPLAVAVHMAKRAQFSPGQTLAIFGCGPLGCLVMAVARAYGVSKILAFDIIQSRVDFARSFGADYAALPPEAAEGEGYSTWSAGFKAGALKEANVDAWGVDVAVEASGAEACMHAGVEFLHPGGTFVQAGLGHTVSLFPTFAIVQKELNVIGTVRYTPGCFKIAIDLMASKKVNVKPMITAIFPLTKSEEALEAVRRGQDLKVVIMNQS